MVCIEILTTHQTDVAREIFLTLWWRYGANPFLNRLKISIRNDPSVVATNETAYPEIKIILAYFNIRISYSFCSFVSAVKVLLTKV